MEEDCPLYAVETATVTMLRHRGWSWQPPPTEQAEAFAFLAAKCTCPQPHCLLFLAPERRTLMLITDLLKIGMGQLRQACHGMDQSGIIDRLQLLSRHPITTQTIQLRQIHADDSHHRIGSLPWAVLLFYPLDHDLVPMHRLATPEERARLGPVSVLPQLRADDAVAQAPRPASSPGAARYLGLRVGDVVRIDRRDQTVHWRLVTGSQSRA